ncbi:MAG TPA: sigma-70 family RNA polymerase sigma factor [Kineosporiaceae bacterium]
MHSTEPDVDGPHPPHPGPLSPVAGEFVRWREGDGASLEFLVRRLSGALWHTARAYGLDGRSAEDVVQVTWLTFVRQAGTIRDPEAVPGWLMTTTRREAMRLARVRARETVRSDDTEPERPEPGRATVEDSVIASIESRMLWRHVSTLTLRCQRLLRVIAFAMRPDYDALSAELDMPLGSIGPTRRRCLDKLRSLLAADPSWSHR